MASPADAQAPRADTSAVMLEVASSLFAAHGFDGTKMADIARRAGVSMTTLYAAHENKEALFEAVIAAHFERHVVPVLERPLDAEHPGERVVELISDMATAMEDDRAFFELYARGSSGVPAKLRAQGRDPYEPYVRAFRSRLVELVAAAGGPVAPEHLAAALAASVIAMAREAVTADPPRPITDVIDPVRRIFGPALDLEVEDA